MTTHAHHCKDANLYLSGHGCPGIPNGTLIATVRDGVQYQSLAINPSFDRFQRAEEFIGRQPSDIVTGPRLVGF